MHRKKNDPKKPQEKAEKIEKEKKVGKEEEEEEKPSKKKSKGEISVAYGKYSVRIPSYKDDTLETFKARALKKLNSLPDDLKLSSEEFVLTTHGRVIKDDKFHENKKYTLYLVREDYLKKEARDELARERELKKEKTNPNPNQLFSTPSAKVKQQRIAYLNYTVDIAYRDGDTLKTYKARIAEKLKEECNINLSDKNINDMQLFSGRFIKTDNELKKVCAGKSSQINIFIEKTPTPTPSPKKGK